MNYFKLFINLQDITPDDGPLTFYSIKTQKSLLKEVNLKIEMIIKTLLWNEK